MTDKAHIEATEALSSNISASDTPPKNHDDQFGLLIGRHVAGSLAATITYAALFYFLVFLTEAAVSKGSLNYVQNGYEELVVVILVALPLLILFPTFTVVAALSRSISKSETWRSRRYQIWVAGLLSVSIPLAATLYSEPWNLRTIGFLISIILPIPIMARVFGSVTGMVSYKTPAPDLNSTAYPNMPKEWNES